jgi:hypothetical protein
MNIPSRIFALASIALVATACTPREAGDNAAPAAPQTEAAPLDIVDPSETCITPMLDQDFIRTVCKPGQKIAFLPQRWGNEQLPILFAAFNCDLDATVVLTNGGVVCRYLPQPKKEDAGQEGEAAEGDPGASAGGETS